MNASARPDTRGLFGQVQAILHRDWDPIGCGVPLDEYDSYVWPVMRILMQQAGRDELARYLRWAADERMTSPVSEERLAAVLDKLLAIAPNDVS